MPGPLDANTALKVGEEVSKNIAKALERNTAALLTVAAVFAAGDRQAIPPLLSDKAVKEYVLGLFNQFAKP